MKIPIEVRIVSQRYCMNCLAQMQKTDKNKFRCPECGEEAEFDNKETVNG